MTNLQVRRVRFDLAGDDVPFNWNPQRPAFAMQCNLITFFAPGFEKMIVDATREAIPLMRDPRQVEEANAYLRQEAQHSAAHMSHFRALARRWPGLQETLDEVIASYDRLTATKPLAWRLAYTAVIENTFTPYFKVFLDHEDKLFAPGDERVASLFIWHFCEEIEHRGSALMVYDAAHGDFLYRVRTIPAVVRHLGEVLSIVSRGFQTHVPAADGGHFGRLLPDGLTPRSMLAAARSARRMTEPGQATYAGVPKKEMLAMLTGLVQSQGPSHDPADENLPPLAGQWFDRYEQEPKCAARWYSVGVGRR
ncbi:metal-dependent hydrolase [Mycolicibacterium sp. 120270]|uniref:metal-dependent hydrolase n=1 Tax=Mycolicibacterium sp. 120270 TaxID=3090600 RepID=UPI00299DE52E|nr:metal-dependent hydrolase [Mycolicibacterium sp. 120270]MDX1887130.1 metal-dependent hydrolase [Mycolicibacterium sp. 120270]